MVKALNKALVIVVSKSKPSFWLSTSFLTVITISEFELAQVQ